MYFKIRAYKKVKPNPLQKLQFLKTPSQNEVYSFDQFKSTSLGSDRSTLYGPTDNTLRCAHCDIKSGTMPNVVFGVLQENHVSQHV